MQTVTIQELIRFCNTCSASKVVCPAVLSHCVHLLPSPPSEMYISILAHTLALSLVAFVSVCRLVNYLLCTSIPFVSMSPKRPSLIFLFGALLLFVFLLLSVGLYSLVHVYSMCGCTSVHSHVNACTYMVFCCGHASTVTLQTDKLGV